MRVRTQLKEIASYSKGAQINGDDLVENGAYDYLNGGIAPSGKWNDFNTPGGTVTISEGGNSCGFVNYMREPFWCGAHCYYLFDTIKNTEYLYYMLKSQQSRLMSIRTGACMPNIKKADLGKFEIEYDTDEAQQDYVVSILKKAESVIEARQQELQKLDDLIKARFVELFGDPVVNSMGWDKRRFDSLCENLDGRRRPITSTDRVEGPYPYYGASGIVDHVADYIYDEDILLVSEDGANLLARSTPIAFSVSGKVWVNNHAHVVRFKDFALQKYIEYYFAMISIEDYVTGSTQPKLNQAKLNGMMIPIPQQDGLNLFLTFIEQVDKSKVAVREALDKAQVLFDSLMQQYFG